LPRERCLQLHMSQGSRPTSTCGGADLFWFGAGEDCSAVAPWGAEQPSASSTDCPFGFFSGAKGTDAAAYTAANKLVTSVGDVNEWTIFGLGAFRVDGGERRLLREVVFRGGSRRASLELQTGRRERRRRRAVWVST